jgi:hypothetical protein
MRVLAAFVRFLGVMVYTLPTILIAGCIALAGLWAINNLNLSSLPSFTLLQGGGAGPSSQGNEKAVGQAPRLAPGETTGSSQ